MTPAKLNSKTLTDKRTEILSNQEALPFTAQLLTEGGDARIVLDVVSGLNKYACAPIPDPGMIALGSSTASIISPQAFRAADLLRNKLALATSSAQSAYSIYARELNRMRTELLGLCDIVDGSSVDVVFAASGTDIHLIAAQAFSSSEKSTPLVIMVEANETGSGVAAALAGRHFSSHSALGESVVSGSDIANAAPAEVVSVALRDSNGKARSIEAIDADFETLASQAAQAGRRVLLIVIDGSKTGTIAPSTGCALKLQQQFAGRIDVMVDACQFRIAPNTLRAYLQRNFMVAMTGSKFISGPTFSGALLIPPLCARRMRKNPIPHALRAYSSRADWPHDWDAASSLDQIANFGLLLRWEAALSEIRAFRTLSEDQVISFLTSFNTAVQTKLNSSSLLEALPLPSLNRNPLVSNNSWDHIPTIHPFLLFQPNDTKGRSALDRDQTLRIYQLLQADLSTRKEFGSDKDESHLSGLRCQFGQPVCCGHRDGVPVSALRICVSMRMIVQAVSNSGRDAESVIELALAALDKTTLLLKVLLK
jgi:hypothetical protein